jgi:hypothetical protein
MWEPLRLTTLYGLLDFWTSSIVWCSKNAKEHNVSKGGSVSVLETTEMLSLLDGANLRLRCVGFPPTHNCYLVAEAQRAVNITGSLDFVHRLLFFRVTELEDRYGSVLVSCCCEKLVSEARGQIGNPEEGERPLLKPLPGDDCQRHSRMKRLIACYSELHSVSVLFWKCSINPITNGNPVSNHSYTW